MKFITILAALTTCATAAYGAALDVWVPPITSPTAETVWTVGTQVNVTWCVSHLVLSSPLLLVSTSHLWFHFGSFELCATSSRPPISYARDFTGFEAQRIVKGGLT